MLKKLKVKYLYRPSYYDIYGFKTKNKIFLHSFSKKLCGKFRKGHFKGVLDVVNRLIEIIRPSKIFLGNKDFQQLYLIKKHIKKKLINTKIISCRTIRDRNYVAYSSRLKKLNSFEKKCLIKIIKTLKNYKQKIIFNKFEHNFDEIKKKILLQGAKKVDYVEILDLKTMKKPKKNKFNIFFAFYIGKIRFVDNF